MILHISVFPSYHNSSNRAPGTVELTHLAALRVSHSLAAPILGVLGDLRGDLPWCETKDPMEPLLNGRRDCSSGVEGRDDARLPITLVGVAVTLPPTVAPAVTPVAPPFVSSDSASLTLVISDS